MGRCNKAGAGREKVRDTEQKDEEEAARWPAMQQCRQVGDEGARRGCEEGEAMDGQREIEGRREMPEKRWTQGSNRRSGGEGSWPRRFRRETERDGDKRDMWLSFKRKEEDDWRGVSLQKMSGACGDCKT